MSSLDPAPDNSSKVLRKLFLTLFLRGRSSKGITRNAVPTSITQKIALILGIYSLIGLTALIFVHREVFLLAAYLHGFTFVITGMFLVSSAGETLFDKDEADILSHRPILPRTLLWAKISVLIQVCFYLSLALNLVGLFVGLAASDGNLLFPIVHLISTAEGALFSAGCVVLAYQLCLRWFGRERMENLMTGMQVLMMAAFIISSQLLPRFLINNALNHTGISLPWWIKLLPPSWFAGLDDAIAGSHSPLSWRLAAIGLLATGLVVWLAFGKLAKGYEGGLQTLNEARAQTSGQLKQFQFLSWLASTSAIKLILRDSVGQVGFLLTAAYLWRDRETKLRVYPTLTTVLITPIAMTMSNPSAFTHHNGPRLGAAHLLGGFDDFFVSMAICFAGAFLGSAPLTAVNLLSYSQQWKASEVFLFAPIPGPWPIQKGAILAVNVLLILPMLLLLIGYALFEHAASSLPLLLVGVLLVPAFGRLPALFQGAVPFSKATEEAKAAGRGCLMMIAPFLGIAVGGMALGLRSIGLLPEMLLTEACLVIVFCFAADRKLSGIKWQLVD